MKGIKEFKPLLKLVKEEKKINNCKYNYICIRTM